MKSQYKWRKDAYCKDKTRKAIANWDKLLTEERVYKELCIKINEIFVLIKTPISYKINNSKYNI